MNGPEGWKNEGNAIIKEFKLGKYADHLAFVNLVGRISDRHDHHPDIVLTYPSVRVLLSTHTANAVTEKDVALAKEIDKVAEMFG